MDLEILVSSQLQAHGFVTGPKVLSVRRDRLLRIDFHPPDVLLYAEIDIERGFAFNEHVFVNPRCRHQGIALRLVTAYEAICRELGVTILINDNRNPAFWKRLGYRRINAFWQMLLARRLDIRLRAVSMYKKV
jgi:GNAT superfamily N-acetyltransferase